MSLFVELKRRNVFRVAAAYLVGGWLFVQALELAATVFEAPVWVVKIIVVVIMLGFVPVLLFAWAYELTPEGIKRERDVVRDESITHQTSKKLDIITLAAAFGVAGLFGWQQFTSPDVSQTSVIPGEAQFSVEDSASTAADSRVAGIAQRSIAVLAFVNNSSDKEQGYFSDGLSEELLNVLAKIPELLVTSRSSAFAFKGEKIDIPEVAKKLNVAYVLEGSVRKSGDEVRITAQLIEGRSDKHLWSESYDRSLEDIFAVQDEIAEKVVSQLKITLLGGAPKVQQTNPDAYARYLQARHFGRLLTPESMENAVELYQEVLAIDPNFVAAWTGLSKTYGDQGINAQRPRVEAIRLAREAANKAIAIDSEYAQAHAALGSAYELEGDLARTALHLGRAYRLAPGNSEILSLARDLAENLGRLDEAMALGEYLIARDPLDATSHFRLGRSYIWAGRVDAGIDSLHTALTLLPGRVSAHYEIGVGLLIKGEPEAALTAFQQEQVDEEYRIKGTAMALHALGQHADFKTAFSELHERWSEQWPSEIAHVYGWIGDADAAFKWLDKSLAQNEEGLNQQFLLPFYAPLYDDPRWLAFREQSGTSEAQLAAIEFEVSLPEQ